MSGFSGRRTFEDRYERETRENYNKRDSDRRDVNPPRVTSQPTSLEGNSGGRKHHGSQQVPQLTRSTGYPGNDYERQHRGPQHCEQFSDSTAREAGNCDSAQGQYYSTGQSNVGSKAGHAGFVSDEDSDEQETDDYQHRPPPVTGNPRQNAGNKNRGSERNKAKQFGPRKY